MKVFKNIKINNSWL